MILRLAGAEPGQAVPAVLGLPRLDAEARLGELGTVYEVIVEAESIAEDARCVSCFSPLFPVEQQLHETSSRRAIKRMPKNLPITFFLEWPHPQGLSGLTLDLSLNGVRFMTDLKLPVGKIIKVDCELCSAVGQVRNCMFASASKHPHWQIGVQFVTLRFKSTRGGFISAEI